MDWLGTVAVAALTSLVTSGGAIIAYSSYRRQYLLHFKAEKLLIELLKDKRYKFRTFKTINHYLGGFDEDEVRRLLVQSGAIRFEDNNGIEIWGLYRRVKHHLTAEFNTKRN